MESWYKLFKSKHCYFFTEWKFGDEDAADIWVTIILFCVRNVNVYSSGTQKLPEKTFF